MRTGTERLECAPDVRIRAAREARISARLASKSRGFEYSDCVLARTEQCSQ